MVISAQGERWAEPSGRLRHAAQSRADLPAVGDWLAIAPRSGEVAATILAVLPRRSRFSRKAAGGAADEQVIAANIDLVFLVAGLDGDFNPRRLERYLACAYDSGASPVIVLNKSDLCADPDAALQEVRSIATGVPVHAVSAAQGLGIDDLKRHLAAGKTAVVLGSSGVGKSTLINALLGEDRQQTGLTNQHHGQFHGHHTTTHRELILLPAGGLLVDTPGLRELALWTTDDRHLGDAFDDIERLSRSCRFRDCSHGSEPGCAVRDALRSGVLDPARFENYLKLQREQHYLEARQDKRLQQADRARWKQIAKLQKQVYKMRQKGQRL